MDRPSNRSRSSRSRSSDADADPGFLARVPLWGKIAGALIVLGLVVGAIFALSPKGPVRVDVHPIRGVVKINGTPAYAVHVYFWPIGTSDEEFSYRHGIGITDKDGRFTIRSGAGGGDGLGTGRYKVTFEQYVTKDGKPITTLDKVEGTVIKTRIPKPHSDHEYPENSPHSATVQDGQNEFEFNLILSEK